MKMRPPILFAAAYGAGLVTGLLHFGGPVGVIAAILLAALWMRRPLITLLGAAAVLGRLSGEVNRLQEADGCAARLPAGPLRLTVRLFEPADSAGGRIRAQPLRAGCHGLVVARWPSGQPANAGMHVVLTGRWVPRRGLAGRPSGTLVISRVERISGTPSPAARLRTAIASASRSLYGARSPMVDALILGHRGGIDRTLQDHFAQSGLVHLLSISGFHVGVITGWVFLACRLGRLRRSHALLVAAGTSVVYVGFLGWPAPATRAAALAVVVALSQMRQRRIETNALLSATCLGVMLVDPGAVLDLGAWLSAAALWGATTFSRWTDRTLGTSVWWRTLGSSIGATLATAPITAATLGTVAVIGIALNFLAIPLAAIAVPGVLTAVLIWPFWPGMAGALAGGSGLTLHLLELLATAGASVPGGHVIQAAELESAAPWTAALAVSLWAIGRTTLREAVRRWSWAAVATLWLGLLRALAPTSAHAAPGLALHFLDVGQGDGAVLRTPKGRWLLIDAGPKSDRSDAGRQVVVPFLVRHGARQLAFVVVSHAHADHLGGVPSVLQRFPASVVIEPGQPVPDPLYYGFLDNLAADGTAWHPGRRGERFTLDSVDFAILHPHPQWEGWGEDVNEDSLVLLVQYGAFQALFAGDAGIPAEEEMRGRTGRVDLLKVGHHGSRGSTGEEWLDSLRPKAAVVSSGRNNYGHPSPETLDRLTRRGVALWRTDHDGPITVLTDGQRMTVRARDRSVIYDVR